MHITAVIDKQATVLSAGILDPKEFYHRNIEQAAQALVAADMGHYIYISQTSGGTTFWENLKTGHRVSVSHEGKITL